MRLSRKTAQALILVAPAVIPSLTLLGPHHPILGVPADAVTGLGVGLALGLSLAGAIALRRNRRCA
jgi:hypothetical protein